MSWLCLLHGQTVCHAKLRSYITLQVTWCVMTVAVSRVTWTHSQWHILPSRETATQSMSWGLYCNISLCANTPNIRKFHGQSGSLVLCYSEDTRGLKLLQTHRERQAVPQEDGTGNVSRLQNKHVVKPAEHTCWGKNTSHTWILTVTWSWWVGRINVLF